MATPDLTLVSESTLPAHLDATLTSAKGYADTKKNEAVNESISDATSKYGGLPQRMTDAETVTESAPFYRRGTLPGDVDLFSLRNASDTGFYTIGSANTNPNLPNQPGVAGELWVVSTGNATKLILTWRSAGGTYEIEATGATFSMPWRRTDRGNEETRSKVLAMEPTLTELVDSNPVRVRGTLDPAQNLREMTSQTWNGIWTVGSANDNPGLPTTPGVPGRLIVENTANDRYIRLDWRDAAGSYETRGQLTHWYDWDRIDRPFSYKGLLPDDTDLSSMTSTKWNGVHLIGSTQNYPNRPLGKGEPEVRTAGMILNFSTGSIDSYQMVIYRNQNGVFERYQTGANTFTDWEEPGAGRELEPEVTDLQNRVELLEQLVNAQTPFEMTDVFTTYALGEAYINLLARKYPSKLSILDLGESNRGLPIRGIQLGDPSKPTVMIMALQHGDEVMGREVAFTWARDAAVTPPAALSDVCVVIVPTVNADSATVKRLSATGTDLNRNWETRTTKEITAVATVFASHDVVAVIDAHEGGNWTDCQMAIPSAEGVGAELITMSQGMYDAAENSVVAAGHPVSEYPGSTNTYIARNSIPLTDKAAVLVVETPNQLAPAGWGGPGPAPEVYAPDPQMRRQMYQAVYDGVIPYVAANVQAFLDAKAAAE